VKFPNGQAYTHPPQTVAPLDGFEDHADWVANKHIISNYGAMKVISVNVASIQRPFDHATVAYTEIFSNSGHSACG